MPQKNKNCKQNNITIGTLAEKAGVNLQTIRYYEKLDLLPEPKRSKSGYRLYDEEYSKHIKFVKNAQSLGFKLEEIKELVSVRYNPKALGKDVKQIIKKKIEEIENKVEELTETKKYLNELNNSCSGKMKSSCCPILSALHS